MPAEFIVDEALTAIVMGYRNQSLIADQILPRVDVQSETFKYTKFDLANHLTLIDSKVDRRSKPHEVDWTGQEASDFVEDQALDAPIPNRDKQIYQSSGRAAFDIEAKKVQQLADLIAIGHEKRTADLVFNANNYAVANKATLSGTSQWSDATSDPLTAILAAIDNMVMRPNAAVMGPAVWSKLRSHPKVTAAMFPNGGNAATAPTMVARQAIADLLELDELFVGRAFGNTAKPGQTPVLSRLWGKDALFYYRDLNITDPQGTVTLGITAQWGGKVSGTIVDPDMGMRGGYRVRAGEAVKEVLLAPDAAYLFKAAVA